MVWCGWASQNHINLVVVNNVPLFFNVRDGPYMPTLRLLHQCTGNVRVLGFLLFSGFLGACVWLWSELICGFACSKIQES